MPSTHELDAQAPSTPLDRGQLHRIDVGSLFRTDPLGRAQVVESVAAACRETGFFYIHNTCIDDEVTADALAQAASFFALPEDSHIRRKVHNSHSPGGTGWGPMFQEPAYQPGTVAHLESFDVSPPVEWVGSPVQAAALGIYPNLWPEQHGFRNAVERYYLEARRLGEALFEVFAEVLGLPRSYFHSRATRRAPSTMRLLHYPGTQVLAGQSNVGIAAHTDFECFTLMYQTAPGLELTDVEGTWRQAPVRAGEFTVILGDMLERLSNGVIEATGHRVALTPWQRYSIILFNALDGDCEVGPLPQYVSEERPARYQTVTQGTHIAEELARAQKLRDEA
jgi:isopenicillin N synthase-like dioxygenase